MKAAIIRITDLTINCDKTNILEQIQDIIDDPDVFELVDFDGQESLNFLVLQTLMNSIPREALEKTVKDSRTDTATEDSRLRYNVGATVANIFESKDYIFAAYYVALEDISDTVDDSNTIDTHNTKLNLFGSQLCSAHVASDLIIIKQDLSYEIRDLNIATSMAPSTIVEYTFVRDIATIFEHRGLIVDPTGTKSEYFYYQNPLENVILTDSNYEKYYRFHEYEVFNYQLTVFVDIRCNSNNSTLNEAVSFITNSKVYGPALLSLSKRPDFRENPAFVDLTDSRFDIILFLRSRDPEITKAIDKSDKVYVNFDKILELAKTRYSNVPIRSVQSLVGILNEDN